MRLLILFFCLATAFSSLAQKSREPRVLFKLAPLALIDDIEIPAIQVGLEIAISKKISWFNEFGFRYRRALAENADTNFITPYGYKIKSEVRYYFNDGKENGFGRLRGYYFAVNLFYLKNVRNEYIRYYYQKDTSTVTPDEFGMIKKVWGGNLIVGNQMNLGKRFMFEYYGGLGVRIRDIVSVNREFDHERDMESRPHDWRLTDLSGGRPELKDGKSGTVNISLGVRFAYKLY